MERLDDDRLMRSMFVAPCRQNHPEPVNPPTMPGVRLKKKNWAPFVGIVACRPGKATRPLNLHLWQPN